MTMCSDRIALPILEQCMNLVELKIVDCGSGIDGQQFWNALRTFECLRDLNLQGGGFGRDILHCLHVFADETVATLTDELPDQIGLS